MDHNLSPLERVKKIWYALFILRIWREYIVSKTDLSLKHNFLTLNCFICIELNAHSLIKIILFLRNINISSSFVPHLYGSQQCEALFRQIRSFTTTYSTVANCSMKEIVGRIRKIQKKTNTQHDLSTNFVFPRIGNSTAPIENFELPTRREICEVINQCKVQAVKDAKQISLLSRKCKNNRTYPCKIQAYVSYKTINNENNIQNPNHQLDQPEFTPKIKNMQLKDYSEKFNTEPIDNTSGYAEVLCDNGRRIVVKKTSLCWLWRKDYHKISSD